MAAHTAEGHTWFEREVVALLPELYAAALRLVRNGGANPETRKVAASFGALAMVMRAFKP
ncbi:MAG: hypothetical protein HY703_11530 [Gemmatimonadetes bacterium]|nr:hypothetical protein [Gemmatimonadota bacterium]